MQKEIPFVRNAEDFNPVLSTLFTFNKYTDDIYSSAEYAITKKGIVHLPCLHCDGQKGQLLKQIDNGAEFNVFN